MESKHTPGPWRWSDEYADTRSRKTWSLLGADGYGILSCDGTGNSPQGLGDKANAALIAAAPELLAALKDIASFATGLGHTGNQIASFARAAIARAEGR